MPDFGASFQQPSLDAEASEGCLVLTRRVIRVHGSRYRVRTACLGTSVPSSPVLILHNVTTYCSCNQPLNPKTISRLPLHSGDPPHGGQRAAALGDCPGERAERRPAGEAPARWRGTWASVELAGTLNIPLCCFSSADHSRSSKSGCWSGGDEKRGPARSEHNAGPSSKSLLPKESRLDTFWD